MSKIVFFNIPAHGHTNPTLGVVRELTARGHEVWYYSFEAMREKLEGAGAKFLSCDGYAAGLEMTPEDGARLGRDLAFSTQVLVDTTLALDGMVCRDMERLRPDCVVADSMAIWGKLAARKLGIPFVSSTTTFAFNRHSSKIMGRGAGGLLAMLRAMPKIERQLRRLRERGYPVKSALDIIGSDDRTDTIVYTSPGFQPCSETFSDRYAFVGPSIRPAAEPVEKTREKLVYISMGTVDNDLLPLYRNCVDAFRDSGYQVVLSVGERVDRGRLGALPGHIAAFSRVDQIAVLERADVFLSHCGMNSVSESLWFGVPLVMLPRTAEQGGVAARVEELGAGIRLKETTAAAIRGAVERVLDTPGYRRSAEEIADGFRRCPGAGGAAEKILEVCGRAAYGG